MTAKLAKLIDEQAKLAAERIVPQGFSVALHARQAWIDGQIVFIRDETEKVAKIIAEHMLTALRDQDAALRGLVEELRREARAIADHDRQTSRYQSHDGAMDAKHDAADRIEKIREGKS